MGREARAGLILLALLIAAVLPAAARGQTAEDAAVVIEMTEDGAIEIELPSGERLFLVDLDDTELEIEVGSRLLFRTEVDDVDGAVVVVVWLTDANVEPTDEGPTFRARLAGPSRPAGDAGSEVETLVERETEPDAQQPLEPIVGPAQLLPTPRIPTLVPTSTVEPSPTPEGTPVPTSESTPVPTPESTPAPSTAVPTLRPACDPSYPDFCIPPPPPDLDCGDFTQKNFRVLPPDPHNLDGDGDRIGCFSAPTAIPQSASTPTAIRTTGPTAIRTVTPVATATARPACDPSYPDFCIPPSPPDLDCKDFPQKRFTVRQPDPHRLDSDKNGIGCES